MLHNAGRIFQKITLKRISYRLFMLTGLVTTMTCGFGGASLRRVESGGGIDSAVLKFHAWTAMVVFLLSLAMAYFSIKALRNRNESNGMDKNLLIISSAFLIVFLLTTIVAYKIR